jgi:hypothetical protein
MTSFLCIACTKDDSLSGVFEAAIKDDGIEHYDILNIQKDESLGLFLFASWTTENPGQRDDPNIWVYDKSDGRWTQRQ